MRSVPITVIAATAALGAHQPASPLPADLIVHNAVIHTMAEAHPAAEGFAVQGTRFVAVGTSAEVLKWRGASTQVIDARKQAVVPGMQDAHGHVLGLGASLQELDLRDTPSFDAIVATVRARVSE